MKAPTKILLVLLLIGSVAAAQDTVTIGGPWALGCQGPGGALLSNGDVATAAVQYDYDPTTAILTLAVDNTTPVIPMANTALLTEFYVNLPASVSGASLVSQTQGSGSAAPMFMLVPGPVSIACLGSFDLALLGSGTIIGGIANPLATQLVGPPGSQVIGPVIFELAITAANPAALTTSDFSQALTSETQLPAGAKFQGSGPGGGPGSGYVGGSGCVGVTALSQNIGLGCGNWMGMDPVLTVDPPILGSTITVHLDSDFPGALYWVVMSAGQPQTAQVNSLGMLTPPNPGPAVCTIYVDVYDLNNLVLISAGLADANGDFMLQVPIPYDPSLAGLEFTLQARMCAPNAPVQGPFQDWFSNGVYVRYGCP